MKAVVRILLFATLLAVSPMAAAASSTVEQVAGYVLGPEDEITVRVLDLEEFEPSALGILRIDREGNIRLPVVGRLQASGLTVEQLEERIAQGLSRIMIDPEVTVRIAQFRSHPVSVLGAVRNPGVHQITGRKMLYEVLSLAGGLNPDAGNKIMITRRVSVGALPLAGSVLDSGGDFNVAELNVRNVMEAKSPEENIEVLPEDVITVPKADLVYVIGAVRRSGGFTLSEKEHISVLQALSLAEGLDRLAAPKNARILRQTEPGGERSEIPVDLHRILQGAAADVTLHANDILFIPTSMAKSASMRVLEAAIQTATGVVIWRR